MLRDSRIILPAIAIVGCFDEPTTTTDVPAGSTDASATGSSSTGATVGSAESSTVASDTSTLPSDDSSSEASTGASDCVALPDGIVAWWRAEGDFRDAIGTQHGMPMGGATLAADGMPGGALAFDGLNGAVLIGNDAPLQFGQGDFTIETWVRIEAEEAPRGTESTMPSDLTIAAKMGAGDTANADGWRLFALQGQFWFCFGSDANGCGEAESTTVYTSAGTAIPGTWSHVAAVHADQQISIYLDGELVDTRAMRAPVNNDTASLYLGASTSEPGDPPINAFFYGVLDEPALYDRALADDEIFALATTANGKCEP